LDRAFAYLTAIIVVAWLLVLAGAVIVFALIVPFNYFHDFLDPIVQGVLATILSLAWIWIMVLIRNSFVRKEILAKTEESS
jgi:hypothetical protein